MVRVPAFKIIRSREGEFLGVSREVPEEAFERRAEIVVERDAEAGYGEGVAGAGLIAFATEMFQAGVTWARDNPDRAATFISS